MINLIAEIGDPIAATFTASDYTTFRSKRVESVSLNTANHDLTYLKSMFNQLFEYGEIRYKNPLEEVKKLKDKKRPKIRCLETAEIRKLLHALEERDSDAHIIAKVCLATGARWSEPLALRKEDIQHGQVTFYETKNGNPRTIPVPQILEKLLRDNVPLKDGYKVFQRVTDEIKLDLPTNQLTHVLRHTFAKSFIRKGGRITDLQKILDHENIETTMVYAQFARYHLIDALELNPLNDVLYDTSGYGKRRHDTTYEFWPFATA